MTTYERGLLEIIDQHYATLSPRELAKKLIEMGIVDFSRLKVLAVREYVAELVFDGERKINAMWRASEHFACTYEYVRKCIYYYTDVNV